MKKMGKPQLTKTKESNVYSYYEKNNKKKKFAYRYRYVAVNGSRKELFKSGFDSAKTAAVALMESKKGILTGDLITTEYNNLTVEQLFDAYIDTKKMKANTRKNYVNVKNSICPYIGNVRVKELNRFQYVQKYVKKVEGKLTENTLATYTNTLKTMLNFAVANDMLDKNRLQAVSYSRDSKQTTLDEETLHTILTYTREQKPLMYPIILFLASTGVRAGEALGLKWRDLDYDAGLADINCTRQKIDNETTPKTKNSYRKVHLSRELQHRLKTEASRQKAELLAKGIRCSEREFGNRYIFRNRFGDPLSYHSLRLFFKNMNDKIGIMTHAHAFRHTYASVLIAEGVDIATAAAMLGDTVSTVQKTYVHALDSKRDEAAAKIEDFFSKVGTKVGTV